MKKGATQKKKHHCDSCLWKSDAGTKVVCPFLRCVRDKGWTSDKQQLARTSFREWREEMICEDGEFAKLSSGDQYEMYKSSWAYAVKGGTGRS